MRGVVAKYNENIDWIEKFKNLDLVIYNKGKIDEKCHFNFENIGRESETYIRYILKNYQNFDINEKIIFLQGNPFDHVSEDFLREKINLASHLPLPITNRWSYIHYSNVFICYDNGIYNKFNTPSDPMKSWNLSIEAAEYLNLPKFHYIIQQTGAQWIVPTKYILNKSLEWWENALSMHHLKIEIGIVAPYIFERLWEKIWYHSDKEL